MLLSRAAEYALRAAALLAAQPPGKLIGARAIAEAEGIRAPYLWKVLHALVRCDILRSFKGIHGGYELARSAKAITLLDVVTAVDGSAFLDRCILGRRRCAAVPACALHGAWVPIRDAVRAMLAGNTLADLAAAGRKRMAGGRRTRRGHASPGGSDPAC